MTEIYDSIGKTYTTTRAADTRIVDQLTTLLGLPKGSSILDVGAGTGNYSAAIAEAGFHVTALEPSKVMRDQGRQADRLTWVDGMAEALPFEPASFDGVMMTLCMHHFTDWPLALREADRVVGRGPIVIFTFDPEFESSFWLFDYFPAFQAKDREWFPAMTAVEAMASAELSRKLEPHRFPLPPDLTDHFAAAGWNRPELYLKAPYRAGISSFASVDQRLIADGLRRLEEDLQLGHWDERYGDLHQAPSLDVGYVFFRLVAT